MTHDPGSASRTYSYQRAKISAEELADNVVQAKTRKNIKRGYVKVISKLALGQQYPASQVCDSYDMYTTT